MPVSWLVAVIVLALGPVWNHGGRRSPVHDGTSSGVSAEKGANAGSRLDGEWRATGRVLLARGISNESTGDVLHRRWLFRKACHRGQCHTTFARTAAYQVQRTRLVTHGGVYTAAFGPYPTACENFPGLPGTITAHFKLHWSHDRTKLLADETAVYGHQRCDPGSRSRTLWVARPSP